MNDWKAVSRWVKSLWKLVTADLKLMMTNAPPSTFTNQTPSRRPFGVTFLIVMVLIFTSLNVLRTITAFRLWDFLANSPMNVSVIYLIITGFVWSSIGLSLAVGLFIRKKWSLFMAWTAIILYALYYWFDRLFIADRFAISSHWQFTLGLTFLILILATLTLTRPRTKAYLIK